MCSARIYGARSAGWRTGGPLIANIKYSPPPGGEAHGTYINIPMTLRSGCPGGLKGCMVPGDAHPYLVPYRATEHSAISAECFFVANSVLIATKLH